MHETSQYLFLFNAGTFSSHGRFAVNDLAERVRRCGGGLGLKEKGIKARAAANHQRLISPSNLCKKCSSLWPGDISSNLCNFKVTEGKTDVLVIVKLLVYLTCSEQVTKTALAGRLNSLKEF